MYFYIIYIQDIHINTIKCLVLSRLGDICKMTNLSYNASPGIELGRLLTPEQLRIPLGQLMDLKVGVFIKYVTYVSFTVCLYEPMYVQLVLQ